MSKKDRNTEHDEDRSETPEKNECLNHGGYHCQILRMRTHAKVHYLLSLQLAPSPRLVPTARPRALLTLWKSCSHRRRITEREARLQSVRCCVGLGLTNDHWVVLYIQFPSASFPLPACVVYGVSKKCGIWKFRKMKLTTIG